MLEPEWFTPEYQPDEKNEVAFLLRPLDQRNAFNLERSMAAHDGLPDFDACAAAFQYAVSDWRGLPREYSREAVREALTVTSRRWRIWIGQIAAEAYRRANLSEDERKNS